MKAESQKKRVTVARWPTLLAATALTLAAIAAYAGYRLGTPSTARARAPSTASLLRAGAMALNFGAFPFGQHPVVRFMLTNTAARPIQIMHLVPSCDCISAICERRKLAVGGESSIDVTYRGFPGLDGPFSKTVSVIYRVGSGQARSLPLAVYGDVTPNAPFVVYPTRIEIGRVGRGTSTKEMVYFRGRRNLLRSLPKSVTVVVGKTRRILLKTMGTSRAVCDRALAIKIAVPATASPGRFSTAIKITSPGFGPVVVRIEGRVVGR